MNAYDIAYVLGFVLLVLLIAVLIIFGSLYALHRRDALIEDEKMTSENIDSAINSKVKLLRDAIKLLEGDDNGISEHDDRFIEIKKLLSAYAYADDSDKKRAWERKCSEMLPVFLAEAHSAVKNRNIEKHLNDIERELQRSEAHIAILIDNDNDMRNRLAKLNAQPMSSLMRVIESLTDAIVKCDKKASKYVDSVDDNHGDANGEA